MSLRQRWSALPLHVQQPPVPHASWSKIEALIADFTPHLLPLWSITTGPFREYSSAAAFFDKRDMALDPPLHYVQHVSASDIDVMLKTEFVTQNHQPGDGTAPAIFIFTVAEKRDQDGHPTRRRIISWPRAVNEVARETLRTEKPITPKFPTLYEQLAAVRYKWGKTIDLQKFFQQFAIEDTCRKFYNFSFEKKTLELRTIPTGHVFPPFFAQCTLEALKAYLNHSYPDIDISIWLDNIRFTGNDIETIQKAAIDFRMKCGQLGISIGLDGPISQHYDFLGITYDHVRSSVTPAQKTRLRLEQIQTVCVLNRSFSCREILRFFGICVHASSIVQYKMYSIYYIFKFVRRISRKPLDTDVVIWPCIRNAWADWCYNLRTTIATIIPDSGYRPIKYMFTDASDEGYGVVLLGDGEFFSAGETHTDSYEAVVSQRFSLAEAGLHINVKELLAIKKGLMRLPRHMINHTDIHLRIDNTSAIGWFQKQRSRRFLVNSILQDIFTTEESLDIRFLSVEYVSSVDNIADAPSRNYR